MSEYVVSSLLIFLIGLISPHGSQAQPDFREEQNINQIIYDAPLKLVDGEFTTIRKLANKKPVILALIFTRCTGICAPYLLQLKGNINSIDIDKPEAFNILVLSFDPNDSIVEMKHIAQQFDLLDKTNWMFGITDSIIPLNNSIGFHPIWDENLKQFNHDALLLGINSYGIITKKLLGLREKEDIKLLISSINNQFVPTYKLPGKSGMFTCFNYDPKTGKNTPGFGLLFIALPAILTVLLLVGIRFIVRSKLK